MSEIKIVNLESSELFEELTDVELTTVVGGASATELGKALLRGSESLLKSAELKLEEEIN